MQAALPDSVSLSIEQAPMDWELPVRKEQTLRPPFRVSMVVKSSTAVRVPLEVKPHVLTEDELHHGAILCRCSHSCWQPQLPLRTLASLRLAPAACVPNLIALAGIEGGMCACRARGCSA